MSEQFEIPVVLILFKRSESTLRIIERISQVKPKKMYLLADYGRSEQENKLVKACREAVESAINWDCQVIKHYAEENRGVYQNIGEGAKWVFEREPYAIFLEDDNLPEVSFFSYCKELLERYKDSQEVLWICGTNYLGRYEPMDGASYMFTKHLLPCGWASWSEKFLKYYDGEMKTFSPSKSKEILESAYENKKLFRHQFQLFEKTVYKLENDRKRASWDFQMAYSIRANNMYGISPKYNQIENIGVDGLSTHGGNSLKKTMTKRFCGMSSYALDFPLVHPKYIRCDDKYEEIIGNIILPPWTSRAMVQVAFGIKYFLGIDRNESLTEYLKRKRKSI